MAYKHIKYGGAGFRTKASLSKINRSARELQGGKRPSLPRSGEELFSAGLIEPTGGFSGAHTQNLYIGD